MDEKKLEAFLAVVRTGSITRAAGELNYTQSGLTQMMNRLESEIGSRLLQRGHDGAVLTKDGERLLEYAEKAADALRELREEADKLQDKRKKTVRIGAYSSISKRWLPGFVYGFQKENPEITVSIRVGSYEILDWLDEGLVDVDFIEETEKGDRRWIPLRDDPWLLVAPKSMGLGKIAPVKISSLAEYPLILPSAMEMRFWERYTAQSAPAVKAGKEKLLVETADDSVLLSMIEQGFGVAVLPSLSLDVLPGSLEACPLDPPICRTLGMALPNRVGQHVKQFVEYVRKEMNGPSPA